MPTLLERARSSIAGLFRQPAAEPSAPPRQQMLANEYLNRLRTLKARFDAAQTTNENTRHWANADYLGPNSELDPGVRRTLRSRARYEAANNSYLSGMLRTLASDTIGTGPELQITDPDVPKEAATEIENTFWEWCQAVRLPQKLRLMRQAKARDGETFAQVFQNPRVKHPIRLDFNIFEADFVSDTSLDTSIQGLLDGLIVDDFGNVIAYNVLREHPGENTQSLMGESDIVPADQIIHLFHADRPGQYRGCPEITPAMPLFAQLRRYTLAVIRSAESAALPSWLMETQQPPNDMTFGDNWETLETERGMGMVLPAGYKMAQLKAEQPTSTYPQFKREILTEIARCLNIPYNVAAGDSSSYNYSSGRLDHRNWYKTRRVERSEIEINCIDRLFDLWWPQASRYLEVRLERLPRHSWRWDGDEHVDPTKEADAAVTRMGNGLSSISEEVSRLGGDAEVVFRLNAELLGMSEADYRARLADKLFGAVVKSSSQPEVAEEPAKSPYVNQ